MKVEKVFSPYEDKKIMDHLASSPIWDKAYKEEELTDEVKSKHRYMFMYMIKFDGLKPIQVTNQKLINF